MNGLQNIVETVGGVVRGVVFLAMVSVFVPVAIVYKAFNFGDAFRLSMLFHRALLWLLNIRLQITGTPSTAAPVFFVANHASYLDIPVLGALLPASFVAKSEVAGWPLFGYLSKLQNTLFIQRRSTQAVAQRTQLQDHIAKRKNLILFPEGTSSNGLTALPFKSSLFGIVENLPPEIAATVQPVSITCTRRDGLPMQDGDRDLYAWYGDMTLEPHLWAVFKHGHFTVEVIFHEALVAADFSNRKWLAATCQEKVAQGIKQSNRRTQTIQKKT